MKLIILALCTFLISAATFLYHNLTYSHAIFLIPDNFHGDLYVVYDQAHGTDQEFDGMSRLYRIPKTGILFTKFKPETSTADQEYFYVDAGGNRRKLMEETSGDFNGPWTSKNNTKQISRNTNMIFDGGVIWSTISATCTYDYQHAFVGSFDQFTMNKGFRLSYLDNLQKNLSTR
jgi:hypothetical protein